MFFKNYIKEILLCLIILLILGIYAFLIYHFYNYNLDKKLLVDEEISLIDEENVISDNQNMYNDVINVENNNILNENTVKYVTIEVKGAITNPGVYTLKEGSIINDAILLAGGFLTDSYTNNINLSKKLKDEMVIYVYNNQDIKDETIINDDENDCVCESIYIDNCIEKNESIIVNENNKTNNDEEINDESEKKLININTSSKEELMSLDGIGQAKAENIINYRNEFGNFKTCEEILNVSGISNTIYEKIKDYITV